MNGLWRTIANVLVVLTLSVGGMTMTTGCREEGPAEEIGESVDEAAEEAGEAVEDAAEDATQ